MLRSLHTAASGMIAQQTQIDVIAHNMANVSTTGFRRHAAQFQDLLYQDQQTPGARTSQGGVVPTGVQIGLGVRTSSTQLIQTQGAMTQTESPLDLAIEGPGYFQIVRPDGQILYTRAGNFHVSPEGMLITQNGLQVQPAIALPQQATSISINAEGVVSATMAGGGETQEVGRLELAMFTNPGGLEATGRGLYRATSASGPPIVMQPGQDGTGTIAQGMLEASNVQVVTEMIDLIASQRAYEINQRVISAADQMLRKTTEF